jgi:hypothetical protein
METLRAELARGEAPLVGATVFRQGDPQAVAEGGDTVVPGLARGLAPVRIEALAEAAA